jgi:hypothetical protein
LTDVQFRKSRGKLHTDLTSQGLRLVIPIRPSSFQTKSDYSYIKTRRQSFHRIDIYLVKKSIISFLILSYIMCIVINMTEASSGHKRRRSSLKRSSSLEIELTTAASGAALRDATLSSPHHPKKQRYGTNEISNVLLNITPDAYARAAFRANGYGNVEALQAEAISKFQKPTPVMIASHRTDVVAAVRRNDLDTIRRMHRDGDLVVNACNKFGESILHIACHRGHTSMVKYMLDEMNIQVQTIRDDYHRTALHDACWTTEPAFEVVDMLLAAAPEHILLKDERGFTPFDYVRRQDHGKWLRFLWERKHKLRPTNTSCSISNDSSEGMK